jgi:hypothetical protein
LPEAAGGGGGGGGGGGIAGAARQLAPRRAGFGSWRWLRANKAKRAKKANQPPPSRDPPASPQQRTDGVEESPPPSPQLHAEWRRKLQLQLPRAQWQLTTGAGRAPPAPYSVTFHAGAPVGLSIGTAHAAVGGTAGVASGTHTLEQEFLVTRATDQALEQGVAVRDRLLAIGGVAVTGLEKAGVAELFRAAQRPFEVELRRHTHGLCRLPPVL